MSEYQKKIAKPLKAPVGRSLALLQLIDRPHLSALYNCRMFALKFDHPIPCPDFQIVLIRSNSH